MTPTWAKDGVEQAALKSPYPWFGGKARVAAEVWRRFGDVRNYVEPFFGGGAVLLGRPGWEPGALWTETVNDINAWLCNFWRAVRAGPKVTDRVVRLRRRAQRAGGFGVGRVRLEDGRRLQQSAERG